MPPSVIPTQLAHWQEPISFRAERGHVFIALPTATVDPFFKAAHGITVDISLPPGPVALSRSHYRFGAAVQDPGARNDPDLALKQVIIWGSRRTRALASCRRWIIKTARDDCSPFCWHPQPGKPLLFSRCGQKNSHPCLAVQPPPRKAPPD